MTLIVAFLTKAARFYPALVTNISELHHTSQLFSLAKGQGFLTDRDRVERGGLKR